MKKTAKIMAICNQKGGVGKSVTAVNLGIGLAREGKRGEGVPLWHNKDKSENPVFATG